MHLEKYFVLSKVTKLFHSGFQLDRPITTWCENVFFLGFARLYPLQNVFSGVEKSWALFTYLGLCESRYDPTLYHRQDDRDIV